MKNSVRILSLVLIITILAACTPAPTAAPTAAAAPSATPTPDPTLVVVMEPTPWSPTPILNGVEYSPMAVKPPVMDPAILPTAEESKHVEHDDGSAASAVYSLVRDEQGPQYYASNQEFIDKMNVFLGKNPDLKLIQVQGEEIVFSMLVNGEGQVYLVFDKDSGALVSADPGRWDKNGDGEWIDAGLKDGESLSLVPGEGGHAYIVKIDADGNIIAYLNTHEATTDNINEQWIGVVDGMPEKVWDGSKWVEAEQTPEFVVDFSENLTPESIEDVAGVVRWDESDPDKLRGDLAILHQEILEALEAEGVTADQLPVIAVNNFQNNAELGGREFFPSEYGGRIQIGHFNEQSQVRAVLTKLDTRDGYVITMPVVPSYGSGDIWLVDFVIDFKLLRELEEKRLASGSDYELINEAYVINKLIPNFLTLEFD